MPEVGQIYRDKSYDRHPYGDGIDRTKRTIRVEAIEVDRVTALTLTTLTGQPSPPRRTKVSFKTLATGYEPVSK